MSHSTGLRPLTGIGHTPRAVSRRSAPVQRPSIRCAAAVTQKVDSQSAVDAFAADARPVVLFDGVCNLCNGNVRIALNNDKHARLRFAALQTDVGRDLLQRYGRRPDDISSIVLATPDGCYIKSDAVLRIAGLLRQPFPALAALVWPIPSIVRDALYDQVANNRYNIFGKSNVCQLTSGTVDFSDRFLT